MDLLDVINKSELMQRKLTFGIPTGIKKRIVFIGIVFMLFWPIVHHVIVTTYDMDHWRYFGLSMYTTPRPRIDFVFMEAAYPGQPFQPVNHEAAQTSVPVQSNLHKLADGRTRYGTLYNPEPVMKEMFDAFPDEIDRLAFTTRRLVLDAEAMLVARDTRTECRKAKERGDVKCAVVPVPGDQPPKPQ